MKKKSLYFDNASTCPINKDVLRYLKKNINTFYGSSLNNNFEAIKTRSVIEEARINISNLLNTAPANIRFTSGQTESNNIVCNYINKSNTKSIITSKFEHESILLPLEKKSKELDIPMFFVEHDSQTGINLSNLQELLNKNDNSFVSLSHVNRISGRLLQMKRVVSLCHKYNSIFHTDLSLSLGKYNIDIRNLDIDIATATAHKFGGIRGAGIIINNRNIKPKPLFLGAENEYGLRPGEENITAIVAMSVALQSMIQDRYKNDKHINKLKKYLFKKLDETKIRYNSISNSDEHFSAYINVVSFPEIRDFENFIIKLDLNNVQVYQTNTIDKNSYIRISFNPKNSLKEVKELVTRISKSVQ